MSATPIQETPSAGATALAAICSFLGSVLSLTRRADEAAGASASPAISSLSPLARQALDGNYASSYLESLLQGGDESGNTTWQDFARLAASSARPGTPEALLIEGGGRGRPPIPFVLPPDDIPPEHTALVGGNDSVSVYVEVLDDGTFPIHAMEGAHQIVNGFDQDNTAIAGLFGQPKLTNFKVYVADYPDEGAYHYPETPDSIVVGDGKGPDGLPESLGFLDAETIESYEHNTNNWEANRTNGEALSRALTFELHPELAQDHRFSTDPAQAWWRNGHKDYINGNPDKGKDGDNLQASDGNDAGNGAGYLFLDYLHYKLGYSWNDIIDAQGKTLGEKYENLTGKSGQDGFNDFIKALPKDANGNLVLPPDGNPFKPNKGLRRENP